MALHPLTGNWQQMTTAGGRAYRCGYCDREISADNGYLINGGNPGITTDNVAIRICPHCNRPTYFERTKSWPSPGFGNDVQHLPADVAPVWQESRDATAAGCSTAAVLLLRKLLMHVAVDLGADEGKRFVEYVQYLYDAHAVPGQAKQWVEEVRNSGNEQNHEIRVASTEEARELMTFMEYLLRGVYEFPGALKARDAIAAPTEEPE